jgi:hypothetical protein
VGKKKAAPETTRTSRELGPRILEALRVNREMTMIGLRRSLGLEGTSGWNLINNAASELVRTGCIEKSGRAKLRYLREPVDDGYLTTQKRMARVIRIRTKRMEPFTVKELAALSDCSENWASRYIKHLLSHGCIEKTGSKRQFKRGAKAPSYLGVEEKLNDNWPALRRRKSTTGQDKLISAIRENAHRIAGFAKPDPDSLEEVKAQAREIIELADKAKKAIEKNGRTKTTPSSGGITHGFRKNDI